MDKVKEIKSLVKQLNEYRNDYYNNNKSEVSDAMYDALFDQLKALEKETGFVLSNSPTQSVGYEVKSKLSKVEHTIPLKSLDKTKSIEELSNWIGDKTVLFMLKADGLTVELEYDNGSLLRASTRGNGYIGEDITHNAKTFKNLPLSIPYDGYLKLVGEAIIHRNDFDYINSKLPDEEKYKTPRNLCSGSVRQLDSKVCVARNVHFYAFNILESEMELSDSKLKNFGWLKEQGFSVMLTMKISDKFDTPQYQLENYISTMKSSAEVMTLPIDGLVATYDSISYSKSLGETSHHPLHSIAFKFEDEAQTTTLKDVEWSVGRTGQITPVAIFDVVEIDGTEVTRASIHNLSIIEELELGIGDEVSIIKANMIIPQIEENFTRSNKLEIPVYCPSCGEETKVAKVKDSKVLRCDNLNCPAQLIRKFSHFVSRDAMNIEGLSEATLEKFLDKGFIETFADIYKLDRYKKDIVMMDGFGLKSYEKLIDSIEKSKNVKLENFIFSLGILNVGKGSSKVIAKTWNNDWFKFEDALCNEFDFTSLEDFGEVIHNSIYHWFNNINERKHWSKLTYILNFIKEDKKLQDNSANLNFYGKKIYCTGTFANYKKDELKQLVENLGAEFTSGYAKSLDYLVVGSVKGSSKEDKAKKDGVKVLGELEFMEMIKN